ncbi:MAG: BACON domain-containing protein [Bacteroidaceae bacterium]|nr:BACON domain-containing protein [Bacteroidaceae bacterium]
MMAMLMLGAVLSLSSCGDDSDPDEVSVSMPSVNFSENGGSQVVQITSNTGWTVSGAQSWLTVAPVSGSKNGSISLMASANTESSSRSCVLYVNAGSASAVITVTQSAVSAPTRVTITNGSVYTLERFRVVFLNSRFEKLTDRDFGTLSPGSSVTVDIPTGATEYYMATYSGSTWYFSPNYTVDYTTLNLTTDEIGNWSANSAPVRKLSAATE